MTLQKITLKISSHCPTRYQINPTLGAFFPGQFQPSYSTVAPQPQQGAPHLAGSLAPRWAPHPIRLCSRFFLQGSRIQPKYRIRRMHGSLASKTLKKPFGLLWRKDWKLEACRSYHWKTDWHACLKSLPPSRTRGKRPWHWWLQTVFASLTYLHNCVGRWACNRGQLTLHCTTQLFVH
jgi:hypothetical protein